MPRLIKLGVPTGVLAFLIAQPAMAQQCGQRMQALTPTAVAMNSEPHPTSERIGVLLVEGMTLAAVDEAACMTKLTELEELIRRRQSGSGQGGGSSPAATAAVPSGGGAGSGARRGSLPAITPPTPFSRVLPARTAALPPERRQEVDALSALVAAVRGFGVPAAQRAAAMEAAAAPATDGASSSPAGDIAEATNANIAAAEALQEILINEPGDVISAELEDRYRDFEEADRAYDEVTRRGWDGEMSDGQLAAYERDMREAHSRLHEAREALNDVRRRQERWMTGDEDGFLPGYRAAERALSDKQSAETRALVVQCAEMQQQALQKYTEDLKRGNAASTAISDGMTSCDAATVPLQQRHLREWNDMVARHTPPANDAGTRRRRATPPGRQPTAPPPSAPAGSGASAETKPMTAAEATAEARRLKEALDYERYRNEEFRKSSIQDAEAKSLIAESDANLSRLEAAYRAHMSQYPGSGSQTRMPPEQAQGEANRLRAALEHERYRLNEFRDSRARGVPNLKSTPSSPRRKPRCAMRNARIRITRPSMAPMARPAPACRRVRPELRRAVSSPN